MISDTWLFSHPQVEVWDISMYYIPKNATFPRYSPRLISPISFFFGPFPKLLLRDHEKKIPLFLSALSSRVSSFSDLPDLCFLASCQLKPNKALTFCTLQLYVEKKNYLFAVTELPPGTFFGVESVERSELALCFEGAGLQGIW